MNVGGRMDVSNHQNEGSNLKTFFFNLKSLFVFLNFLIFFFKKQGNKKL